MRLRSGVLFLLVSASVPVVLAQQAESSSSARASKPHAKVAAPPRTPKIELNSATCDGAVTGNTDEPDSMVEISVYKPGGEFTLKPDWPWRSGKFSFAAPLLRSGWMVQAWVVRNGTLLSHSTALVVACEEDPNPVSTLQPVPSAAPASQIQPPPTLPPAPASGRQFKPRDSKVPKQPVGACDDGDPDEDAELHLSDGDSEISGRISRLRAAKVTVCVNGEPRSIKDTKTPSNAPVLEKHRYDVTLSTDPALKQGNYVLVVFEDDNGRRASVAGTVGPPEVITAKACEAADESDQRIYLDPLRAGAFEITAMVPAASGTVTVCVNDVQSDIAEGPGPAKDTAYGKVLPVKDAKVDLLLKAPVDVKQLVRIAWLSDDQKERVTFDATVQPVKLSAVKLPSIPREGESTIKVDTAAPGADLHGHGASASKEF